MVTAWSKQLFVQGGAFSVTRASLELELCLLNNLNATQVKSIQLRVVQFCWRMQGPVVITC